MGLQIPLNLGKFIWGRVEPDPVLVTNQVYSDFDSGELELVGRDIPKYSSRCLIHIERASGTKRKATIIKHRSQPEGGSAEFLIKNEGLVDAGKKFGIF